MPGNSNGVLYKAYNAFSHPLIYKIISTNNECWAGYEPETQIQRCFYIGVITN